MFKDSRIVSVAHYPEAGMDELFTDQDPKRAERAMLAMLGMGKLDIAALRRAAPSRRAHLGRTVRR